MPRVEVPDGFSLVHCNARFAPAELHIWHKTLDWLDVYVSNDLYRALCEELPHHLNVPPAWEAYLNLPTQARGKHPLAWTWGFTKARQLCLPRHGVFTPLEMLDIIRICDAPDADTALTRELGFRAYRSYVRASRAALQAA